MNIFLDANICLDLLDTTRVTSKRSIDWYLEHKDDERISFYFSADFITTIYYVFTEKRKIDPKDTLEAIDRLSSEITPYYLVHNDFISAKNQFLDAVCNDFEDLLILQSARKLSCVKFITNDKELLKLNKYMDIKIIKP
ncbi:MAG: type II toxin-antitoxin system VapC family toxin [Campylobacterales bacterium]